MMPMFYGHGLCMKLEKCRFDCKQMEFLSHITSFEGISMDLIEGKTILDWLDRMFFVRCAICTKICKFL